MKKFYTLLTLCLAFIGITTASAQNAPEFSNEKCYTVKADRSSWVTSTAGLKTLNDLGLNEDSTDPNQQFAFLTKDGATYLYSVGQAAFITKSGSLGAFATDPVYFTPSKDAGTFMVYFDDSHYINIGGSKQMAISNWKTGDIGNNYTFTEAGEFDPTSALASATPSAAISDLSELSNEKLYTVQQKNRGTSWAVASDAMVSSKQAGVVTGKENDPKQQFAFITSNETTYIYYAADKKFVNKDGSLSETPVDPIAFVNGESEGTFVVKFDDSHYVNVGGSGNMEINDWSTADNGNSNTFTPVADFDPTEVLKLFAPATPEATTVVSIDPACGELEAMPSTVKVTFSNDIKAVNVAVLQSNATGAMGGYQFTAEDYTISGKELTLNLPEQYVSGQALALIILQVVDVNDQPVTYSSENTDYAQEGMIFLQYTAPLKSDLFAVVSADPAEGSTVSMLDVINVTFGNPNYTPMFPGQSQSVGGFDSSKEVVLLDAAGDVVTKASMEAVQENGWNTATVAFTLDTPVSTNGKYTLVIPAGTVYNEMYYEFAEDFGASYGALYNPEVRISYTVVSATPEATTVVSIDPACGELEAMPSTVKVTFSNDIKAVNVAVLQSNATGAMGGYQFTAEDYTISGKELTLNLPEQYVSGQALALIILQVVDVNDQPVTYSSENTDYAQEGMIFLQYTAPLKSDLFAVVSADPAEGSTVSMLDVINVTFGNPNYTPMFPGQSQSVGGFDSSKEVVLLDAAGDVVTKASMEAVQENGWNTATVAFTLDTPVSTNGKYTLVIPAGTVYNEMYYEFAEDFGASYGALYNPEVCLNYTVGTSIEFYPEVGEIPVTTETLTFTFSKEIQAVNEAIIQSSTVQLPPLTADVDYFFWGNELSINLPREYTLKAQDLSVILQVIDEDGNPVTYHNHSFFPEQEGMIFVEYTLVPVEPTIVEMSPEPGEISAVERSIYLSFNTDIAEVEVAKLQSTSGEMPELVLDENLFVWGKDISIVLPLEYTAKASDLSVVLKVKDIQGKYVTYGEEADMVNLAYTLVPVTPTVEDAGAEGYTITTATSAIDIMFSTPLASVTDCMINAHWGSKVGLEEGVDYSIYDNILTVNLPKELLAEAAEVEEANRKIVIGFVAEDIQGKQVVYTNSEKWDQETAEDYGMTFLEYSIVKVTEVESVSPECGFYEVLPSEITLTFDTDIKAVDYGTIHTQLTGFRGYMMTEDDYVIDGNKLTINVPEAFLVDQSLMQIRMNVVDVKGMYVTYAFDPGYENEGAVILEYTAPVKADLYKMVSSDPAEGAVEKLDVINVAFEDAYGSVAGGFDPSKEVVVLNAAGEVVAKAAMEVVFEAADEYGWAPATNVVKFTLDTPVTETGIYTFVIPAGTVYNEMFYPESEDFGVEWGALYNPEISITYTIGDVTGINGVTVNGKSEIYSIDGRKVTNPTKGIYVVNGKKVVVK